MSLLRTLTQSGAELAEDDATERGTLIVELLDGRCYEVVSETWEEDEHSLNFETGGEIVARFNRAQVLMVRSVDAAEIHRLAA